MKKRVSEVEKGVIALVCLTALFASLSVIARLLHADFTILQQVYLRVLVALLLSLFAFRKYIRWRKLRRLPLREWSVLAFRGIISYVIAVPLISLAANTTLLSHVAFISALPFIPLLGFLFLKEKVTWWKLTFVFAALLGVSLLSLHDVHNLLSWGWGDVVAIVANLGFAIGYVTRRWHTNVLNNQEITTLTFIFGAGFAIVLSLLLGEGLPKLDSSWTIWIAILLGGIFNVANLYLINYSFEHVDAVRAGNLLTLEVVWGLLFGLLLYSEWPAWQGLIGGIVIVISVIGMNVYSRRDEAKIAALQEESDT